MSHYTIELTQRQLSPIVDHTFLDAAIRRVLREERIGTATISVVFVGDAEIHRVNREFLGHDCPTDVISFLLNSPTESIDTSALVPETPPTNAVRTCADGPAAGASEAIVVEDSMETRRSLEAEVIVNVETAVREAGAQGWSPRAELLLYVVHGLLHLCGYDDLTDEARRVMRARERELLALWGLCPTGLEP